LEKHLISKKVLNHINFRFNKGVDHILFYPDPTQTQQQHQPFIKHLGFGFFKAHDHPLSTKYSFVTCAYERLLNNLSHNLGFDEMI